MMVPEGWKYDDFAGLGIAIIDGDRGSQYPKSDDFLEDGHCVFLSAKNVTKTGFKFEDIQFISEEKHRQLRKGHVYPGNIVLTTRGTVGQFGYFDESVPYKVMRINSGMVVLDTAQSELSSEFLYAACRSQLISKQVESASFGSAQPALTVKVIKKFKVPVPPLPEQKKIAQILSTWDQAITATERLLENSQQRKKGLMQQLLTGKKRLPGFDREWEWLKANEIFRTVSKKNNGEQEELLAVTQDQGVLPRSLLERRVVMPDGTTSGYKLVVPGNFIISLRSFQGGLEYSHYRGLVSPAYTVLEPIREISDGFYQQYYKSYDFIGHLAVAVIGIRDGKQISYSDFSFLKIPHPPLNEQKAISNVLAIADREIKAMKARLDHLQQEKRSLMQQLLTGKRRVKVDAEAA